MPDGDGGRGAGVLALAFPLHPPGKPEQSRLAELRSAGTSVLVINGSRDPFGVPGSADGAKVVELPGETHALSGAPPGSRPRSATGCAGC